MRLSLRVLAASVLCVIGCLTAAATASGQAGRDLTLLGNDSRLSAPHRATSPSVASATSAPVVAPVILDLGPPPALYSPAADFLARTQSVPACATACDGPCGIQSPACPTPQGVTIQSPFTLPAPAAPGDVIQYYAPYPVTPYPNYPTRVAAHPHPAYNTISYDSPVLAPEPVYAAPISAPPVVPGYPVVQVAESLPPPPVFAPSHVPVPYNPAIIYPMQPSVSNSFAYQPPLPYVLPAQNERPGPKYTASAPPQAECYSNPYCCIPSAEPADRLDHILQAVHHLEAAGMQTE